MALLLRQPTEYYFFIGLCSSLIILFPQGNIHKYIWTSSDGKTHNQIDPILVDRRRLSNVLDVRSFRAADCDSDHYLVVAKVRERLAVNKQGSQRSDMERFNLKKLNDVEGKEQFRVEFSNRFAALALIVPGKRLERI
jgi:hypothetical protein